MPPGSAQQGGKSVVRCPLSECRLQRQVQAGLSTMKSSPMLSRLEQLFFQVAYNYPFSEMLGDIDDLLKFSEHNIEWQLIAERQSIQRRTLDSFGFDDHNLAQLRKDELLDGAEHRFKVALPMQIRYAALGALTNTTQWAARFFKSRWIPELPTKPKNLCASEVTASLLLKHFVTTLSLPETGILADYFNLVQVRNAVVHNGGVICNYSKLGILEKAIDSLKGFSITDWHFFGKCIEIERGALNIYIEAMSHLLYAIHKTADERGLLQP
jgi:hypothetical protein